MTQQTCNTNLINSIRDALLRGEKVVVSDHTYDSLIDLNDERLDRLVSIFNPNQHGTLDTLVAWIKQPSNDGK